MVTKKCLGCKNEYSIEEFPWKSKKTNKRQPRCKKCYNEYNRKYYANGERDKQIERVNIRKKTIANKFRAWKNQQSCRICGENAVECLDLHHIDPSKKDREVSQLQYFGSWKKIEEEIAKCAVLCANCHRKVHGNRISL